MWHLPHHYLVLLSSYCFFGGQSVSASGTRSGIRVLCYHSIADHKHDPYIVSPAQFEEQMKLLHEHGYHTINMEQFDALMKGRTPIDRKAVLITFDDGYADNYTKAYPILKRYHYTATLFLVTNWVQGGSYVNWQQVTRLHEAGWDIMSHTRTHPYLPLHSAYEQSEELTGSKNAIDRHFTSKVYAMAYPYGFRSEETVKLVSQSGYSYAFTFDEGWTEASQNPYLLKRLFISGKDDLAVFRRKLLLD